MIRNNIFVFTDEDTLHNIINTLVIDGNININILPKTGNANLSDWLLKYWGVTKTPIKANIKQNKISFDSIQELHINTLMQIAKLAKKGAIECLSASDVLGEGVKHITISQQVPIENNITISKKEFACLVWDKDYYDYIQKIKDNKNLTLADIADLEYTDDGYSDIDSILAIGDTNFEF